MDVWVGGALPSMPITDTRISDQIIRLSAPLLVLPSVSNASLYIYEVEQRHIMAAVIWGTVLRFMYVAAFGLEC